MPILSSKNANITPAEQHIREFVLSEKLTYSTRDNTFVNYWGNRSGGKGVDGGVLGESGKIQRLAFQTMRQYGLTGAGHDVQWYSLECSGYHKRYIRFDDFIDFGDGRMTAQAFFEALSR